MAHNCSKDESSVDFVNKAEARKRGVYKKYLYDSTESVPERTLRRWAEHTRLLTSTNTSINEEDDLNRGQQKLDPLNYKKVTVGPYTYFQFRVLYYKYYINNTNIILNSIHVKLFGTFGKT